VPALETSAPTTTDAPALETTAPTTTTTTADATDAAAFRRRQ